MEQYINLHLIVLLLIYAKFYNNHSFVYFPKEVVSVIRRSLAELQFTLN